MRASHDEYTLRMYTQFTKETRIELAALLTAGHSCKDCAAQLGMLKSSVTREVARNAGEDGRYTGAAAHRLYCARRIRAKIPSLKIQHDSRLRKYIRRRLVRRDSPEQIAGRIARMGTYQRISYETIYTWIFNEAPALKKL